MPLRLCAQVQSQGQPATAATFTSSTHLVVEAVTVRDKNGKVIGGLKKEAFVVTEDGKPQEIKFFDIENVDEVAASSDFPPTTQQVAVQQELKQQGDKSQQEIQQILDKDVAAFNAMLRDKNILNIIVKTP